jgi:alpha-beta hydrolase superfamily lysophospholipase
MEHYEKRWLSFDKLSMYSQTWASTGSVRAVINLVHGLGEHSGRYGNWASQFTDNGYCFRSFDLRGHGKSGGKRGFSSNYSNLLTDIHCFLQNGRDEFPSLPFFLYGHSLGGNLLLNYAIRNTLNANGLIITSPWLDLVRKPSPFVLKLFTALGTILPTLRVSNGLRIEDLSRDSTVIQAYADDMLVHNRITLRLALQIFKAGAIAASSIHKINVPMLLMHGSSDQITSCKATRNFVRYSGDKTNYIEWDGGYHELHNDMNNNIVFRSIIDWLDKQL